jgi:hypothetical protein
MLEPKGYFTEVEAGCAALLPRLHRSSPKPPIVGGWFDSDDVECQTGSSSELESDGLPLPYGDRWGDKEGSLEDDRTKLSASSSESITPSLPEYAGGDEGADVTWDSVEGPGAPPSRTGETSREFARDLSAT